MPKHLFTLLPGIALTGMISSASAAEPYTLETTIVSYECGDNCYLNVTDAKGESLSGLCTAPLCEAWNMETVMPPDYVGKKVRIVVGEGQQLDGNDNVVGTMQSFDQIEVLP